MVDLAAAPGDWFSQNRPAPPAAAVAHHQHTCFLSSASNFLPAVLADRAHTRLILLGAGPQMPEHVCPITRTDAIPRWAWMAFRCLSIGGGWQRARRHPTRHRTSSPSTACYADTYICVNGTAVQSWLVSYAAPLTRRRAQAGHALSLE
jgi:hypothetical protein